MMDLMRECSYWSCVVLSVGGVLLLFMQQQRGWLAVDVSPRECLRFWRGVVRNIFRNLSSTLFCQWFLAKYL